MHPSDPDNPYALEYRTILSQSSITLDGRQAQVVGSPADAFAEVEDLHDGRREFFGWDVLARAVQDQRGGLMSASIPSIDLPDPPRSGVTGEPAPHRR